MSPMRPAVFSFIVGHLVKALVRGGETFAGFRPVQTGISPGLTLYLKVCGAS